jgi:hypothetical protein
MAVRVTTLYSVLVLLTVLDRTSAEDPKNDQPATLQADLKKLEGQWHTVCKPSIAWSVSIALVKKAEEIVAQQAGWEIEGTFKRVTNGEVTLESVSISVSCPFELKEVKKNRAITPGGLSAKAGLPKAIPYRFEGDALILTVPDGDLKGEYKLERVK